MTKQETVVSTSVFPIVVAYSLQKIDDKGLSSVLHPNWVVQKLTIVVGADRLVSLHSRLTDGRQQDCDDDRNDRHDCEDLRNSEPFSHWNLITESDGDQ